MRILIFLVSVFCFWVVPDATAQTPEEPGAAAAAATKAAEPGAAASLKTFSRLVTRDNYRTLGFQSPDEPKSASLGDPISVFAVGLDDLKKYAVGSNPNALLKGPHQVLYPVVVGGQVRSAVTLEQVGGIWKAADFGGAALGKSLNKMRGDDAASTKSAVSSYFAVQVPALNLYFVGHQVGRELKLIPLLDDASLDLKAGSSVSAGKLFERLVPLAKAHNELPT